MISFNEKNILLNLNMNNKEEAIDALIVNMMESGHVNRGYYKDVMERENQYPTGLPTVPIAVAIPHAKSKHVNISGVGVAVLKNPVEFNNMVNPDEKLSVKLVFLLANQNYDDQLRDLCQLMEIFASEELLSEISEVGNTKEFIKKLHNLLVKVDEMI